MPDLLVIPLLVRTKRAGRAQLREFGAVFAVSGHIGVRLQTRRSAVCDVRHIRKFSGARTYVAPLSMRLTAPARPITPHPRKPLSPGTVSILARHMDVDMPSVGAEVSRLTTTVWSF